MNNTVCTRYEKVEKVEISEIGRVKSVIGTTTIIKMDETIIASTSKWRGERKEGEKDATRSKRKKINTILYGGPSKATTAAAVARFHHVFLSYYYYYCFTFFFLSQRSSSVPQKSPKIIKILFRWKQKQSADRQRAKSYYNSASDSVQFRSDHYLMFRGWFIWRSPTSCARYFYYYLPLYERTRFIGPFARVHLILLFIYKRDFLRVGPSEYIVY